MAARTRVVIVGGGVLGTMHAVEARRRGSEVVQQLTIGDTHEYAEPFAFDLDEEAYDHPRGRPGSIRP